MNDLIVIRNGLVGESQTETVDARELHAFLEVGKDFATWIKDRIEQYDFIENQDFVSFHRNGGKPAGGRPSKDYTVTLDMAKELAMVERNDKGKQARQYFIECERRLKKATPALPDFSDPVAAARAWADAKEAAQKAIADLAAAKPAVEFVERYVDSSGSKGIREVAKLLNANEREFVAFLIDRQIMYRLAGRLTPYAPHLDAGRFEVKAGVAQNEHAYTSARFTTKGIQWVAGLWIASQVGGAA